jgi:hypothetical protein
MALYLSHPSPAKAWGGWPSRSDGRVGVLTLTKKSDIDVGFFKNPHPVSLSLADPPHKGEGEEGAQQVNRSAEIPPPSRPAKNRCRSAPIAENNRPPKPSLFLFTGADY